MSAVVKAHEVVIAAARRLHTHHEKFVHERLSPKIGCV